MSLNTRIKVAAGATLLSGMMLFSGLLGSTTATYASTPITVGGKAVVANTDGDNIRVRSGAGTGTDQIAEAHEGEIVNVLAGPERDAKGNRWFKVKAPGGTGWIVAGFLEGKDSEAAASSGAAAQSSSQQTASQPAASSRLVGFARVANTDSDPLRLRTDPSRQGNVLTMLAADTSVAIKLGPVTDKESIVWYQVSANSVTGWVMGQYLAQDKAPNPAAAAAKPAQAAAPKPAAQQPTSKPVAQPVADTRTAAPPAAEPASQTASRAGTIVDVAMRYVGYRYRFGGTSPSGFDCSGFIYYVLNRAGVPVGRDMYSQLNSGARVSSTNLRPGDLLFFSNTYKRGLSHAGIYIGNGKFVHAENESTGVTVSALWSAYWSAHYTAAVRPSR